MILDNLQDIRAICKSTGHYADVDTPSGVEEVLESTSISTSQPTFRASVTSELSEIPTSSSQDEPGDHSMFGLDDQPSRSIQTPAEVAEALSQAVDDLDITDVQDWADKAAVDLSNDTQNITLTKHSLDESPKNDNSSSGGSSSPQSNITKLSRQNRSQENSNPGSHITRLSRQNRSQTANSQDNSHNSQSNSFKGSQSQGSFTCEKCQKTCRTKAGLNSHSRVHK